MSAESPQHCMERIQVGAVTEGQDGRALWASGGSAWDGACPPAPCPTGQPGEEKVSYDSSTGKGEAEGPAGNRAEGSCFPQGPQGLLLTEQECETSPAQLWLTLTRASPSPLSVSGSLVHNRAWITVG